MLYLELEKLKENERRFRKDRDELLRTLLGIESGLPDLPIDDEGLQGPSVEPKKKKKGVASSVEPQTPITPTASNVISLAQPQPPKKTAKSAAYGMNCVYLTAKPRLTRYQTSCTALLGQMPRRRQRHRTSLSTSEAPRYQPSDLLVLPSASRKCSTRLGSHTTVSSCPPLRTSLGWSLCSVVRILWWT